MTIKRSSQQEWIHFSLFLVLALLWSGSFINIKIVVSQLPPIFCAMVRVLISLLCLSVLFAVMRKKVFMFTFAYWRLWMAGFFVQALPFALLFFGEKFIAPALASILNSTVSIWALVWGAVIFRDVSQWTPIKITGIFLGFAGIIIIFAPFIRGGESSLIGIISILCMAISYSIGSLINQHIIFKQMTVGSEANLIQQHLASVLFLLLTSLTLESWPSWSNVFTLKLLLAFFYLGIMATAIAWMIYFYLLREWGAVRTTSVMYIVPVLAILWDFLFLHLIPTKNEVIGMFAILTGVTFIQWVRKPVSQVGKLRNR
jgi:drug/metabolite transporter (DMT)-like permease